MAFSVELLLAVPDQGLGPSIAAHPIANVVLVTVVYEHGESYVEERR